MINKLTQQDFIELLEDMAIMVIESELWPVAMVIDPVILYSVYPKKSKHTKISKYRIPVTLEMIPVIYGKPGEFRLQPSDLAKEG